MNKKNKVWLALAGFMGGVGFTMIAFHFNHKNILNESLYFWSVVFCACLVFCLLAILRKDI
jgi:predicted tellurium resistance membrane protein TerC